MAKGDLVGTAEADAATLPATAASGPAGRPAAVLEHEPIAVVSYPYEWPFALLKRAALLHLDLHLDALEHGVQLVDGSACNVQFRGTRPVFIDVLSFRPYAEGEYWDGYRQFCAGFLAPLLLTAWRGIPYQAWYRGSLSGIPVEELAPLLPARARFSPTCLMHVCLQAALVRREARRGRPAQDARPRRPLRKSSLRGLLTSLRAGIARLEPPGHASTPWAGYAEASPYTADEASRKADFVVRYARRCRPRLLWDIGCNTGHYGELCLGSGAAQVVGFDSDPGALEGAVARADRGRLAFLPLQVDVMNPTPAMGWALAERRSLGERGPPDGMLALALLHHLAIGGNVPLDDAVDWLVGLAPSGVIEFVPKGDPMVQRLLARRRDIFPAYTEERFLQRVAARARVVECETTSATGRILVQFERPQS
jgi:ribosomal protein L11 methylase PrmA